jgi:GTP-binding protein
LEDGLFWVDLPGYGYAKAPGAEKERWSKLIADYCGRRKGLAGVIWLLDVRHPGLAVDMEARGWFGEIGLPVFPVLTKGDKLSRSMQKKRAAEFREAFGFEGEPVVYSALEHGSRERFWSGFDEWRRGIVGKRGGI